jgi:hypothetical protein
LVFDHCTQQGNVIKGFTGNGEAERTITDILHMAQIVPYNAMTRMLQPESPAYITRALRSIELPDPDAWVDDGGHIIMACALPA